MEREQDKRRVTLIQNQTDSMLIIVSYIHIKAWQLYNLVISAKSDFIQVN